MGLKKSFFAILHEIAAEAHCDIPCGIYEPTPAKIAAMTVLRMVLQMSELRAPMTAAAMGDGVAVSAFAQGMARRIAVKEQHAEMCKKELLILWTDFFKPEHLEKFPALHDIFWKAAKLCSANKQEVSEERARELVASVDNIAKIFYEAKGVPERYDAYQELTKKLF